MPSGSLDPILAAFKELRAAVEAMEERGDRVPLELEEKVHLLEELIADMVSAVEQARKH